MPSSLAPAPHEQQLVPASGSVTIACPDARPPAYQAAIGLAQAGRLQQFATSYYYDEDGPLANLSRRIAPARFARIESRLKRRHDGAIPGHRVRSHVSFDLALAVENRVGGTTRGRVARWRTRRFDRSVARSISRNPPDTALVFSDVGSEFLLPTCRELGIRSVLSMVHGDIREEREVLAAERESAPDFFPIYLGDGPVDAVGLDWLHQRRLLDLESSDAILVPSDHIADTLVRHGTDRDRITVIPYAADTTRFRPTHEPSTDRSRCRFLFAGGITQRKGIKYLLEAWRRVRRPGWSLGLLGGMPRDTAPLASYRDEVEWLGRVGHADVPGMMADFDVFVFPSLFEGSAVVTYEALACGLPSIVTPQSGSVVRDGRDGVIVPSRDVETLASAMDRLGRDPELRAEMARSARLRAEEFDWPRYHASLLAALDHPA